MSTAKQPFRRRLRLEALEERCVPSTADASSTVSGFAFVDRNGNRVFNVGEQRLPGAPVRLVGTTIQNVAVNLTARANAQGNFTFTNVLPGTYRLASLDAKGRQTGVLSAPFTLTGGETIRREVPFGGLNNTAVSLRQFLTSTTISAFPEARPGTGSALANYRPNNRPIETSLSSNITVARNSTTFLDMAGYFDDPDLTNSRIRFKTNVGDINVELFDKTAPRTVANFFNYITSNRYDNTIFHRLATGFVLQGGGFTFDPATRTFPSIPVGPTVQNEFGPSNTLGTIAMAKLGNDPNSATSQFFFNLANNSSNLDTQNGGFTVFGRLVGSADQATINRLAAFIPRDATPGVPDTPFETVPTTGFTGTNFPADATLANFARLLDVEIIKRDEFLSYSVVSNSNPGLLSVTPDPLSPNQFRFVSTGTEGSAQVVIRATDRYGASRDRTFNITIENSAPSATVTLTPAAPNVESVMKATIGVNDPDGDPVEVNVVWDVDGTEVRNVTFTGPGEDELDLAPLNLSPGQVVTVRVTPTDGNLTGNTVSASRTLVDRAPTVDSLEFDQDEIGVEDTLTVTVTASDPEGTPVTLTYVWSYNGVEVQRTENTAALSDSLDLSTLSVPRATGDVVSVQVIPTSNSLTGASRSGELVVNRTPTTTGLANQSFNGPGDFVFNTVAAAFSDPDGDTLSFAATLDDGSALPFWLSINPATGVLRGNPPQPAAGTLRIKVTATDPLGKSVSSSFDLTLSNTPASMNDVPSVVASFEQSSVTPTGTLTANWEGEDADGDALLYDIVWSLNGNPIRTVNGTNLTVDSLNLGDFSVAVGDTIEFSVTPKDPYDAGMPSVISIVVS
ncbi:MAG: peptidylprolyl isomerase [Gemmataceae bacterium]